MSSLAASGSTSRRVPSPPGSPTPPRGGWRSGEVRRRARARSGRSPTRPRRGRRPDRARRPPPAAHASKKSCWRYRRARSLSPSSRAARYGPTWSASSDSGPAGNSPTVSGFSIVSGATGATSSAQRASSTTTTSVMPMPSSDCSAGRRRRSATPAKADTPPRVNGRLVGVERASSGGTSSTDPPTSPEFRASTAHGHQRVPERVEHDAASAWARGTPRSQARPDRSPSTRSCRPGWSAPSGRRRRRAPAPATSADERAWRGTRPSSGARARWPPARSGDRRPDGPAPSVGAVTAASR